MHEYCCVQRSSLNPLTRFFAPRELFTGINVPYPPRVNLDDETARRILVLPVEERDESCNFRQNLIREHFRESKSFPLANERRPSLPQIRRARNNELEYCLLSRREYCL